MNNKTMSETKKSLNIFCPPESRSVEDYFKSESLLKFILTVQI